VEKKNPIAEQSRQWLVAALLALMEERPYHEITIKEIAYKAGLSRRTFYRNFVTKEDLLSECARELCEEYIAALRLETDLSLPNIARVYFSFWKGHLELLDTLKKGGTLHLMLNKYNEYLPVVYNLFKGHLNEYGSPDRLEYVLAFSAGGFWNMLAKWLDDGAQKSPEELAEIVRSALENFGRR